MHSRRIRDGIIAYRAPDILLPGTVAAPRRPTKNISFCALFTRPPTPRPSGRTPFAASNAPGPAFFVQTRLPSTRGFACHLVHDSDTLLQQKQPDGRIRRIASELCSFLKDIVLYAIS
ncbi:hypothetical protein EVAR_93085_1 [Eumeta japonica]|uniref:Uncharacterized protein n=1 Tax=Eumeta variegata TaxID=151549 RepID=A0A4C1TI52_EUMVA|nr:hypothetical protein EVAR_93085_1 [Eumeta japonica]